MPAPVCSRSRFTSAALYSMSSSLSLTLWLQPAARRAAGRPCRIPGSGRFWRWLRGLGQRVLGDRRAVRGGALGSRGRCGRGVRWRRIGGRRRGVRWRRIGGRRRGVRRRRIGGCGARLSAGAASVAAGALSAGAASLAAGALSAGTSVGGSRPASPLVAAVPFPSAGLPSSSARSHSASGSAAPSTPSAGAAGFSSPAAAPARAIRPSATASATTLVRSATLRIASSFPGIG